MQHGRTTRLFTPQAATAFARRRRVPVFLVALLLATGASLGASGSGELTLDRAAVTAVVAAGLPKERVVQLPVGRVTLELTPPDTIKFVDGGLEGRLGVKAKELGLSGAFLLRFVPRVEADRVYLDLVRAAPQGAAGMLPDLSSLMPPVEVPNGYEWMLELQPGDKRMVNVRVADVAVRNDRMVISWRLKASEIP